MYVGQLCLCLQGMSSGGVRELYEALRRRRKELGLRQKHLAAVLDLDGSQVSRLEGGKRQLSLSHLEKWLDLLRLRMSVVPLETTAPAEIELLDGDQRALVLQFARVLPGLPPELVRDMRGRIKSWLEDYAPVSSPAPVAASPIVQDKRARRS